MRLKSRTDTNHASTALCDMIFSSEPEGGCGEENEKMRRTGSGWLPLLFFLCSTRAPDNKHDNTPNRMNEYMYRGGVDSEGANLFKLL